MPQHQYDVLSYLPVKKQNLTNPWWALKELVWKAHSKCFGTDSLPPNHSSAENSLQTRKSQQAENCPGWHPPPIPRLRGAELQQVGGKEIIVTLCVPDSVRVPMSQSYQRQVRAAPKLLHSLSRSPPRFGGIESISLHHHPL